MATRTLEVRITGDPSSFNRSMRGIDTSVDRTEGKLTRFGKVGAAALAGVGVAAAAGAAVGLKKAADAAIDAEKAQASMVTQLKAAGISYRAHAKQIDEVIQKHSKLSGLDDEDLQRSFTNIVRVTGDVDKGLRLTGLAADFARAKHMDVAKAGELVGKVAGGNTGILSRYGIQIEKGASATEALGVLQAKFAGQAQAYGRTTAGALDRASVASENLGEVVGAKLTPALAKAAIAFSDLIDKSGELAGPIRRSTGAAADAVDKFRKKNAADLSAVGDALRRVTRFFRWAFEETIAPIVRRLLPVVKGVLEGIGIYFRATIRIVTGIINGDWKRVWQGFLDFPRSAVKVFKTIMGAAWRALRDTIKALAPLALNAAKDVGEAIVKGIVSGIKSAGSAIGGAIGGIVKGAAPNFLGIGEGIGKRIGPSMGVSGLGGGALMGADPDLAPFAGIGARFGLRVSSGLRPGAITSSGNPSLHATGDAVDLAGSPGGMLQTFRFLKKNFGSRLSELIYTPGGVGVKDGRPYTYSGQVAADHFDHVHVGYEGPFGDGPGHKPGTGDGPGKGSLNRAFPRHGLSDAAGHFQMTSRQVRAVAEAAGFPAGVALQMDQIAQGESTRYPGIVSFDGGYGLWQMTPRVWGGEAKAKMAQLGGLRAMLNPVRNAQMAKWLYDEAGGFGPWYGTRFLNRGMDTSKVKSVLGKGGGAPGAGGGAGGSAGTSNPLAAFRKSQRAGARAEGVAVQQAQDQAGGSLGFEGDIARVGVRRAKAEKDDDLAGVISAMSDERAIKRKRLRAVRRALRTRMGRKRRIRLLNEEAQLVSEIGDLTTSIKEFKADRDVGGATTISRADQLDAGVDTEAVAKARADAEAAAQAEKDVLVAAQEEANRIQQLLAGLVAEQVENQRKIIALTTTQGPQLIAAVVAAVNGGIGGPVGLGFSTPGYAGSGVRY